MKHFGQIRRSRTQQRTAPWKVLMSSLVLALCLVGAACSSDADGEAADVVDADANTDADNNGAEPNVVDDAIDEVNETLNDESGSGDGPLSVDPVCDLIEPVTDEIYDALGLDIMPVQTDSVLDMSCTLEAASQEFPEETVVSVIISRQPAVLTSVEQSISSVRDDPQATVTDASGLGDGASMISWGEGDSVTMYFMNGGRLWLLEVQSPALHGATQSVVDAVVPDGWTTADGATAAAEVVYRHFESL